MLEISYVNIIIKIKELDELTNDESLHTKKRFLSRDCWPSLDKIEQNIFKIRLCENV